VADCIQPKASLSCIMCIVDACVCISTSDGPLGAYSGFGACLDSAFSVLLFQEKRSGSILSDLTLITCPDCGAIPVLQQHIPEGRRACRQGTIRPQHMFHGTCVVRPRGRMHNRLSFLQQPGKACFDAQAFVADVIKPWVHIRI